MSVTCNETLIEMPDHLYKNPPKPKREDIARLFDQLVRSERHRKFYIYEGSKAGSYRIQNNNSLFGVVRVNNYDLYKSISLLCEKLSVGINYIIKDPLRSKHLKILSKALNVQKSEKVELKVIRKKGRLILSAVFY